LIIGPGGIMLFWGMSMRAIVMEETEKVPHNVLRRICEKK
jgi:hypothetical protein